MSRDIRRHAGKRFIVTLTCGHTHYRRTLARKVDLYTCPYCGEFGQVTEQHPVSKALPETANGDTLSLFDQEAVERLPPPF